MTSEDAGVASHFQSDSADRAGPLSLRGAPAALSGHLSQTQLMELGRGLQARSRRSSRGGLPKPPGGGARNATLGSCILSARSPTRMGCLPLSKYRAPAGLAVTLPLLLLWCRVARVHLCCCLHFARSLSRTRRRHDSECGRTLLAPRRVLAYRRAAADPDLALARSDGGSMGAYGRTERVRSGLGSFGATAS